MAEDLEKLTKTYEAGAATLNEILDDLTWRKKDVAMEEKILKDLEVPDPAVTADDLESQEIVVRSARQVLDNEIKEAEELDVALKDVKAQIEKLAAEVKKPEPGGGPGEAVP